MRASWVVKFQTRHPLCHFSIFSPLRFDKNFMLKFKLFSTNESNKLNKEMLGTWLGIFLLLFFKLIFLDQAILFLGFYFVCVPKSNLIRMINVHILIIPYAVEFIFPPFFWISTCFSSQHHHVRFGRPRKFSSVVLFIMSHLRSRWEWF